VDGEERGDVRAGVLSKSVLFLVALWLLMDFLFCELIVGDVRTSSTGSRYRSSPGSSCAA
jgi:hypothetical protein